MLIVMLMLAVALLGQLGGPQDVRRTMAAGEIEAVYMLPPDTVCGSETTEFAWSGDGKQLVAVRRVTGLGVREIQASVAAKTSPKVSVRNELVVWDPKTRKSKTALTVSTEGSALGGLDAIPGSDRFILGMTEVVRDANGTVTGHTESVGMLSASTLGIVKLSTRSDSDSFYDQVMVSPSKPIVVIRRVMNDRKMSTIRFVGSDGRLSLPFPVRFKAPVGFDAAGYPGTIVPETTATGKPKLKFHRLNTATGQEMGTADFVRPTDPKPDDRMVVRLVDSISPASVATAPAVFLQLKGGKEGESGVVSTDGVRGELSPTREAVAYVSQGSLMVRLLATMPRSAYDQARAAAERTEALSKGKQLGVALMMFAGDMDDMLPSQDVDLRSKLGPYTKNSSLFENFTYTYSGGSASAIGSPAETELGYVTGPGGRAVIFADGHVKWRPDAP